ncbi:MAG: hypothetical protein COB88_08050 [Flavobacteriales bacterium]|nr:MAG: hypothetical protein COB88_08050 [Flavobacteriales bacterium]
MKRKTLVVMILELVEEYGWKELSELTRVSTFRKSPDFTTSLKYLHKTPSAKKKVEDLYFKMVTEKDSGNSIAVFSSVACEVYL